MILSRRIYIWARQLIEQHIGGGVEQKSDINLDLNYSFKPHFGEYSQAN
jgi:hypothetical protein